MAIPLPQAIGNYRIIAKLGQGGMARALLAVRKGRGGFRKLFVIKQLRPELLDETDFVEMFFDEARIAALLSHPNVVQTHEIIEDDGECAIAMEYLEGQPLSRLHRRVTRERFPLPIFVYILTEVLAGLYHAHNLSDLSGNPLNVVHRDVSPGNVFITYDGQIKLLDFGIAKAAGATSQTRIGGIKGKLAYMAPEQAMAEKVDCRADLFSVGILLWEALAERTLVERKEPSAVTLNNRVNGNWPPISHVRPDAPPELIFACEKSMAMDRADRYADADELRRALLEWLERTGLMPTREQVAEFVTSYFGRERKLLSQKIADKIAEDAPYSTDEVLLSKTSLTSVPGPGKKGVTVTARARMPNTTQRPKSRAKLPLLLVASALIALIGGVALTHFITQGSQPTADAHPSTEAKAGNKIRVVGNLPNKTSAAEDDKTIELYVSAAPNSAAIELDGKPLTGNPYRGRVARDQETHELIVSAAGHKSSSRTVRFTSDIHIELTLTELDEGETKDDKPPRTEAEKARARARAKARAKARARAKAEAKAAAEAAARAKAEEEARLRAEREAKAKAKAKAKKNKDPKAGDVLTRPKKDNSRKIDEENPYE